MKIVSSLSLRDIAVLLLLLISSTRAASEDFPFDTKESAEGQMGSGSTSHPTVLSKADVEKSQKDNLSIGGDLRSYFQYYALGGTDFMMNPSELELYFDAKQSGGVRMFTKASLIYDPTVDDKTTNILTGTKGTKYKGDLEEMKIMFNAEKRVFFTVGKQKIKWGSGHFWNPTDFMNNVNLNPLLVDDERSGVSLIKVHIPVGSTNFYLIDKQDNTQKASKTEIAGRVEIPLGTSEVALSAVAKKGQAPQYGVDVSFAVFDFDFYCESSYVTKSDQIKYRHDDTSSSALDYSTYVSSLKNVVKATLGVSYDISYGDKKAVTLVGEYYDNPDGYASKSDYLYPFLAGALQPFNLGQRYGMFAVYLPKPGHVVNFDFMLLNLSNITDGSYLSQFSIINRSIQDLWVQLDSTYHYGDAGGEMRLGDRTWDIDLQLRVNF